MSPSAQEYQGLAPIQTNTQPSTSQATSQSHQVLQHSNHGFSERHTVESHPAPVEDGEESEAKVLQLDLRKKLQARIAELERRPMIQSFQALQARLAALDSRPTAQSHEDLQAKIIELEG